MKQAAPMPEQERHLGEERGKPWGWTSSRDWPRILSIVERYEGLKNPLPIGTYYTNAYLPKR